MEIKPKTSQTIEHLYHEHHSWLYVWLSKRIGNQNDAADLAQETFIRLLQKQQHYQDYQPRALLITIAKNLSNTWWKRKKIELAYHEAIQHVDCYYYPSAEEEIIAIQMLLELQNILDQLKPRERQVFLLSQIDGLTYAEIAIELQVSIITVKRDIKHAMLKCLMTIQLD